ncbi:DUF1269 domain-containing protein, partial [Roseimaritima sediminicola]|uniref:DUF1269 domain-containing protein n=1 Tax=Roseimaritima sediminicola TaxID=2662066 RepID=UPI001386B41C
MSRCLIAEFDNSSDAKAALEILEKHGYTLAHVSVVSSVEDPAAEHLHELVEHRGGHSPIDDRNTSLGMLIGGSLAAPIAAGTLIGPFIIAGPLVGMALGAAVGSLLRGTHQWGVAHDVSEDYEQRVRDGATLVIVNDEDNRRLQDAEKLLRPTDPRTLEQFEVAEHPSPPPAS